jgi:HK97 gp10 family phage protein
MADELAALKRQIDQFPADVTTALRAVASVTAGRVQRRARQIVASKVKRGAEVVAITIRDEPAEKQFLVIAEGSHDKPANLALWLERGTRYMTARPFMRPAADAETRRYQEDMMQAAERAASRLTQ